MSFERVILANLVNNQTYTRKVMPFLKTEYFRNEAEKKVFEHIEKFVQQYNVNPTKEALAINISNSNMHEGIFEDVIEVVKNLEPDENPIEWLIDESEKFCRDAAIYNALNQALDIADGQNKDLDKNAIPQLMMDALGVSFDSHVGHDYFDSAEAQWEYMHSLESKFPFTIGILNKVTKNGVPNKTLNIIGAPINCGKSVFLIQQSADWLAGGKNVLYISMEMAEEAVRERIDVNMMQMTFDQVHSLEKRQYLNRIEEIKKKTQGRLFVKEYAAGSAHVGHFRHLLQELKIKHNFVPDMIAIDYLTICASSKLSNTARGNTNTYFGSVAEEIRAFAKENDLPVWTAVQLDRSTQGASDAGMNNVGLAISIAATADFMFIALAPDELKERNLMIGKIVKNRYSNHKIKFLIGMDPSRQMFYDVDESTQGSVMSEEELSEMGLENRIGDNSPKIDVKEVAQGWSF